jgi:hypothetical protein
VSDQLHALAAPHQWNGTQYSFSGEAEWAPVPVWMVLRKENSFVAAVNGTMIPRLYGL